MNKMDSLVCHIKITNEVLQNNARLVINRHIWQTVPAKSLWADTEELTIGLVPNKYHTSTAQVPHKYHTSTQQVPHKYPSSTPQVPNKWCTDNPNIIAIVKAIGNEECQVKTIMERMAIKDRHSFLDVYLTPAITEGYVRMLYPDSPRHPRQRYLLTVKGNVVFEEMKRKEGNV